MTILLVTIGSAGDVHPFIGIGLALRDRGHRVKVITNPYFEDLVRGAGLEFGALGTVEEFNRIRANADLWDGRKGLRTVCTAVVQGLRETYQAVMSNYVAGETVVAASSLALGARIAQDKHGVPTATVHLAPAVMRSAIAPPKLPGLFMPAWLPRMGKQLIFGIADRWVIDPLIAPAVNEFRRELGLGEVSGIIKKWWHSPRLVIGLWPRWFAPVAADWPAQVRLTGFPLFDEAVVAERSTVIGKVSSEVLQEGVSPLHRGLDPLGSACTPALGTSVFEFLAAGEPPIVFTPGSAMMHGHDFFRESVGACVKLNRRGILLTRHLEQVPANMPAGIRHFSYVPFSQLLGKAAVLVHHGGIGTSAQGMARGVKQLVMPMSHDQFDNGNRLERLGIGRVIERRRYRADLVAKVLGEMLADANMGQSCREIAGRFKGVDALGRTCELIEGLARPFSPSALKE